MPAIKSIIKYFSLILTIVLSFLIIMNFIIPNKSFFEDLSSDITMSVFGLEPKYGWKSEINLNKNIKSGYYIKPYILGVKYPKIWISSKDSVNKELISKWKLYDASF